MHLQTHLMSGWCVANCLPLLAPRDRLLLMLAATLPDLDGLSLLFGQEAYWHYHHRLGHNVPFALLLAGVFAVLATRRATVAVVTLALVHLHFLMDLYGSGTGWGIYYLWPMSSHPYTTPAAWEFYSWQNITAAALLLAWTLAIAVRLGRTPLEAVMPRLDRQLVGWLRQHLPFARPKPVAAL